MPSWLGILVVALGGLGLISGIIYYGIRENQGRDPLQDRLAEYGDRDDMPQSLDEIELSLSFTDRVVRPIFQTMTSTLARFTPENQLEQTRHQLELAGMANKKDARSFFGERILLSAGLGVLGFMVFFVLSQQPPLQAVLYTVGFVFLGYYLPVMSLKSKITRRQQGIVRALPDALDLLTICVEAGLAFDQAMGKVYEKWDNDLAIAFGRVIQEIALGKLRREALRDMAKGMDVNDVTSFTAAIIQADQLGVSISKILRVQADQMRIKRRQRAQEKAHEAPVKMLIPMVFLIFPSIWIVLLGPSIIILMNTNTPL